MLSNDLRTIYASLQSRQLVTRNINAIEGENVVIYMNESEDAFDRKLIKVMIPFTEMDIEDTELSIIRGMVGAEIDFLVKKIVSDDPDMMVVTASRKDGMELRRKLEFTKDKHIIGERILVRVTGIGASTVRVDVYGVETIVDIKEVDWGYINDLRSHLNIGDNVPAVITAIDKENFTVEVSLRQAKRDPFERAKLRFVPESEHEGRITNVNTQGIFVELTKGINIRCNFPKWKGYNPNRGDIVLIRVRKVDENKKRITGNLIREVRKAI